MRQYKKGDLVCFLTNACKADSDRIIKDEFFKKHSIFSFEKKFADLSNFRNNCADLSNFIVDAKAFLKKRDECYLTYLSKKIETLNQEIKKIEKSQTKMKDLYKFNYKESFNEFV